MRSKRLGGDNVRHVLVFDKGDEVIERLLAFARQEQLTAASFTGIGAFRDVTLGFFERESKDYKRIPLVEQVEVLTLAGDIALKDDEPQVHAHVVVGKADGTAWGGHLLEGHVWPTLELVLVESPAELRRTLDEETQLPLIAIEPPRGGRR
jgi:predicted DNA-binding protein with PD1-like motif